MVAIALFLFLGLLPAEALAVEGECHLKHCLVPSPTILMPIDGDEVTMARPEIRGLTWKTAPVKVYIDGQELNNIQFRKHEDYYGSFFVVPDYDLTPGEHFIYAIAHSEKPGWYDQSKESIYVDISVKRVVVLPRPAAVLSDTPPTPEPIDSISNDIEPADTADAADLPAEKINDLFPTINQEPSDLPAGEALPETAENQEPAIGVANQNNSPEDFKVINSEAAGKVNITSGQIEGGVSVEQERDPLKPTLQEAAGLSDLGELLQNEFEAKNNQEREKKNRLIGLVMLAIILVVAIIWLSLDRKNKIRSGIGGNDEGVLPPPPVPPKVRKRPSDQATKHRSAADLGHGLISLWRKFLAEKSKDEEIPLEPIKEEDGIIYEALVDEPSNEYWASPPPSRYSPYPPAIETDKNDDKKSDLGL